MRAGKVFTILFSLLFFVSISGCKKDTIPALTFLKVGHQWAYLETYQNQLDTLTLKITADSSGIYSVVISGLLGTQTTYWFVNGNYLKYYSIDSLGKKSQASVIFEITPRTGDNWKSVPTGVPGVTDSIYSLVSALNVTDTTFNGIYTTTTVAIYDSTVYTYGPILKQYWSKDEGLISEQGLFSLNLISKNF